MIELTRLNGTPMVLNSDLIKTAEASPDTMLTLINGEKLIVREDLRRGHRAGARLPGAPAGRRGPPPAPFGRITTCCLYRQPGGCRASPTTAPAPKPRDPEPGR